jgi:hypothetical protein
MTTGPEGSGFLMMGALILTGLPTDLFFRKKDFQGITYYPDNLT